MWLKKSDNDVNKICKGKQKMKRRYTRKQILESIDYWRRQLRKYDARRRVNESKFNDDEHYEYLTPSEKDAVADFTEGLQLLLKVHSGPFDFNLRQLDESDELTFSPPFTIDDLAFIAAEFIWSGDSVDKTVFEKTLKNAFVKMDNHADLLLDEDTGDVQFG